VGRLVRDDENTPPLLTVQITTAAPRDLETDQGHMERSNRFDYRTYRKNRRQVNFLLKQETAETLTPLAEELFKQKVIPQATLPALAKLGIKVVARLYASENKQMVCECCLKKGEL
jgi:hypothetical protein